MTDGKLARDLIPDLIRESGRTVEVRRPATGLVRKADYLRYLELAEQWADDPLWQQEPDVVEYALFAHGGKEG